MLQCPVCLRDKNGKPTAAVGTATVPGSNVTKMTQAFQPPEPDDKPTLRPVPMEPEEDADGDDAA